LDFISSDETLDRYNEIISASGWKLANYQRNPVFQNAHQYGDILHTLGRALVTQVTSGKLMQRIEFACDVNPMARIAYGLYKGKFLNAVSVGFVPVRWEDGTDKTTYRRRFLEQELLEVSAVGIPANPNALALGLKSGAVEKSDLKELADLLRLTLEGSKAVGASPSPGGPRCAERFENLGQPDSGGVGNSLGRDEGELSSQSQLLHMLVDLRSLLRS
jgi:HK97 family phage prohead protease